MLPGVIGEHVLIGFVDDPGGREALELARVITRVTGARLTVATVHPPGRAVAGAEAQSVLAQAEALLGDVPADLVMHESRGVGRGLSVLTSRIGADLIVIGSPGGGAHGRISLGGTADQLLHSAPQAVVLTPAGYEPVGGARRITVAYVRRPQCDEAVVRAAGVAERLGALLRLVTLSTDGADTGPLRDDLALAIRMAANSSGLAAGDIEAAVGEGDDVADAVADVAWEEGDLLVCASSEDAPVHRVFLGETAFTMVRVAPCPVAVLPGGHT